MKYAIELLQRELRDEIQAHAHATEWFQGTHSCSEKIGLHSTGEAFKESQRLADERIPQLMDAISILTEAELQSD